MSNACDKTERLLYIQIADQKQTSSFIVLVKSIYAVRQGETLDFFTLVLQRHLKQQTRLLKVDVNAYL